MVSRLDCTKKWGYDERGGCLDHDVSNGDSSRLSTLSGEDNLCVFQSVCLQRSKFHKNFPCVGEVGLWPFFEGLFDEVSNCLSHHSSDLINLRSAIYTTTPYKVAKSNLVESVLGSGRSDN